MLGNAAYPTYQAFISLAVAAVIAAVIMPLWIRVMRIEHFGQQVRADGPEQHLIKQGTPTMGGVVILVALAITCLVMGRLTAELALVLIAVLSKKGVRGAVLWGILGGAALYYVLGLTVPGFYGDLSSTLKIDFVGPFRDFGEMAFGKVFTEGFDFSAYVSAHGTADLVVVFITTSLAFCMVDMFDTLGTLYGACARGNMLLPNGEVPNMDKAMLADAIATTTGAICGTSTVTTFVESSAGVAEGGRTGLAAMATAALFFIAMFLSPIASLIPTAATAAALIYVGVLMINCVKDLDWMDPSVALPSFLTMAMMPFTYNISYGIAFGLISYVLIRIFTGKIREVKVGTWVITILFLLMLFLTH